jgi:general transcription factor 3C polypeptide 3 (transcription factor C subunit 4)
MDAEITVPQLQEILLQSSPDTTGDLYLDVAEAYIDKNKFQESLIFLERLVESETYGCEGAVWLRFARVLKNLKETEKSIDAYKKVIVYEPNHFEARLELSQQLVSLKRLTEAAEVSSQSTTPEGFINLDLLTIRCNLLFTQKKFQEFVEAAITFLVSDMILLHHEMELACMISNGSYQRKMDNLKEVQKNMGIDSTGERNSYVGTDPSAAAYFEMLIKLCYVLSNVLDDQLLLKKVVFSSYNSMSLVEKEPSLDYLALMTVYKQKDLEYCSKIFRIVVNKYPGNYQVWNVFCPIVSRYYQDLSHNRFCLRLFMKHPDLLPLMFFNGHNALMAGSYKHTVGMSLVSQIIISILMMFIVIRRCFSTSFRLLCPFKRLRMSCLVIHCISCLFSHPLQVAHLYDL